VGRHIEFRNDLDIPSLCVFEDLNVFVSATFGTDANKVAVEDV
jgi:hypothetical protein